MSPIRRIVANASLLAGALLGGCAAFNTVGSDVASYGSWPAGREPGTYTFDRLPSQQKSPQRQEALERAAAPALQAAGFKPAPDGIKGDFTVQIGARIDRYDPDPWADPFWMPGLGRPPYPGWWQPYGPSPFGYSGWRGSFWHPWPATPEYYDREVAVLVRNGADGKPLYEARATNSGATSGGERVISAMFSAALKDFPQTNDKTHTVSIEMPPAH
jgi:hypothetical protein